MALTCIPWNRSMCGIGTERDPCTLYIERCITSSPVVLGAWVPGICSAAILCHAGCQLCLQLYSAMQGTWYNSLPSADALLQWFIHDLVCKCCLRELVLGAWGKWKCCSRCGSSWHGEGRAMPRTGSSSSVWQLYTCVLDGESCAAGRERGEDSNFHHAQHQAMKEMVG